MRYPDSIYARSAESIGKPLGFYVLALLIVEGFLTTLLVASDLDKGDKRWGMWAGIGLFVLVVGIVSAFVWVKPTNLTFTGHDSLVSMGIITYGTDTREVKEKDLPSGTVRPG